MYINTISITMNTYQETFTTWNQIASDYESTFSDIEIYNHSYDVFLELVNSSKSSVLDIGCGPGNITRYLLNKQPNLRILGVDISPNMINIAKKRNPSAQFRELDCRNINHITSKYKGIICGFILPYFSKEDCDTFFKNSYHLLDSQGVLYISFVPGLYKNSGFQTGKSGNRLFFYYHQLNTIQEQLKINGFHIVSKENILYSKSDLTQETHIVLICKKF